MLKLLLPAAIVTKYRQEIKRLAPDLPISTGEETGDDATVTFVVAWQQPVGSFARFPRLQAVMSVGAGYDHIVNDSSLPKHVSVARVAEDWLSNMMVEYAVLAIATQRRHWLTIIAQQQTATWQRDSYSALEDVQVGVLGLGPIGQLIARKLQMLGYCVSAWSRTAKTLANVKTYAGKTQLNEFLKNLDFLICVLPRTAETTGFINYELLKRLPVQAYVINIARGELLIEADLLRALDEGHLSGACLDVFNQEPLSKESALWRHPKIRITPHIAGVSAPKYAAKAIVENYHRLQRGESLLNQILKS